ncbi:MAG: hypothetical protein AB7G11_06855 [Phycisphaerales bacterium]
MKRFCPYCGYDQFGRIPAGEGRIRCHECEREFATRDLHEISRQAWWWYWLVAPWCLAPAFVGLIAPLVDKLAPGYALNARLTFWSLALSPVFLYVLVCWGLARHRLARWYFGAIIVALVLTVINALLIGALIVVRS